MHIQTHTHTHTIYIDLFQNSKVKKKTKYERTKMEINNGSTPANGCRHRHHHPSHIELNEFLCVCVYWIIYFFTDFFSFSESIFFPFHFKTKHTYTYIWQ